jgi:hypothetical protein
LGKNASSMRSSARPRLRTTPLPREDAADLADNGRPARDTSSMRACRICSPVMVSPALAEAPPPPPSRARRRCLPAMASQRQQKDTFLPTRVAPCAHRRSLVRASTSPEWCLSRILVGPPPTSAASRCGITAWRSSIFPMPEQLTAVSEKRMCS